MTLITGRYNIEVAQAMARQGALEAEIRTGLPRTNRGQTAYSIVKDMYGFSGSRQRVLRDLTEYIECEIRLRHLTNEQYELCSRITQKIMDKLGDTITQVKFERFIEKAEAEGNISNGVRQAASDMFYVVAIRHNAEVYRHG